MATVAVDQVDVGRQGHNDSPLCPMDDATEPAENACCSAETNADNMECDDGLGTSEKAVHDEDFNNCHSGDGTALTKAMIKVEEKLHRESEQEENKIKAQHDKIWSALGDDEREKKYNRLQFLLRKSNLYTEYLLERMKRQQEEEVLRQERLTKRLLKHEQRKKQSTDEHSRGHDASTKSVKKELSPRRSLEKSLGKDPLPASLVNDKCESPKNMDASATRGRKMKGGNSSQNSEPLETSQDSVSTGGRRGRKRKAETKSPDIRPFFSPPDKRQKMVGDGTRSTENCVTESSKTLSDKNSNDSCEDIESDSTFEVKSVSLTSILNEQDCDNEKEPCDRVNDKGVNSVVKTEPNNSSDENDCMTVCNTQSNVHSDSQSSFSQDEQPQVQQDPVVGKPVGQPSLFTGGTLRQYQIDGFNWLKMLYENGVNGILADEMGLGKTVQCIAAVAHLVAMGVPGPFLVCAPLSTLPNWHIEFIRFAPKIPIILYHGSKDERMKLRNKIKRQVSVQRNVDVQPVVITSYEISMNDRKFLQYFDWKYLIVDEGHRIKNTHCRLIRELRLYRNTHRLLLTGTPLQNNLAELWSLLNFLLPEIFDDLTSFEAWFDVGHLSAEDANEKIIAEERRDNILSMLHQILTPFMLRRLKTDVDLNIPPKKEILVYAPLLKQQQKFYTALVDRSILRMLEKKDPVGEPTTEVNEKGRPMRKSAKKKVNYELMLSSNKDSDKPGKHKKKDEEELEDWVQAVMEAQNERITPMKSTQKNANLTSQITIKMTNIMMQLRKCCNHPYLLEYPLDPTTGNYKVDDELIRSSGKMVLLDQMLQELKKRGHKVLIFSQMTKMLDIIEDYCYYHDYDFCRLDGSYKVEDRQVQMKSFNEDPDKFLFLLSTRAGGLGINLVAADTVIIYDSDWNPQSDLQAQDRCHRIGQTRPVVVYRYVTTNSIDQRIVERAAAKRKLEKMVIHQGKFKSGMKNFNCSLAPLSSKELLDLLKSNDHQAVATGWENDRISKKSLEKLLDRSDIIQKWKENLNISGLKKSKRNKEIGKTNNLFKVLELDDGGSTSSSNDISECKV